MKWLAPFLCLLALTPAVAEDLPPGTIQLPSSMVCGPYNPGNERMGDSYGEIPFLEGNGQVLSPNWDQAYHGEVEMFLNPKNGSYTLFLHIRQELTCMIVTGEGMKPIYGDGTKL